MYFSYLALKVLVNSYLFYSIAIPARVSSLILELRDIEVPLLFFFMAIPNLTWVILFLSHL